MGGNKVAVLFFKGIFQKDFGIKPEHGAAVCTQIADTGEFRIDFFRRFNIGYVY